MTERRYTAAGRPALARRSAKSPVLTGYASVFFDEADAGTEYELWSGRGERCVERILPGAFDRALKEDDVRGLFNHNPDLVLGRTASGTMRLSVDKCGLKYEIDPPDTQFARDVMASVARGDITGSSFSFDITDQTFRESRTADGLLVVREVRGVKLADVGPVTSPAYGASTAGTRAAGDPQEARAALEAWKAARESGVPLEAILAGYRARAVSLEDTR